MSENKFKRAIMAPGFLNPDGTPYDPGSGGANVTSVNGETGDVTLTASDVDAASSAQGALADSAVQPGDLATVATTGAYGDLSGTPTIPTIPQAAAQVDSAATDVPGIVSDFNDLLAKLRAAGIMAT